VAMIIQPDRFGMSIGEACGVLAAIGGAAAALVIWSLSTTEPAERQMFYFTLFALLLSAIPLPWTWQLPGAGQLMQILLIAAFTTIGQYFYAKAFTAAPGDKVNTWSYMSIVFAALIGLVAWHEAILATSCRCRLHCGWRAPSNTGTGGSEPAEVPSRIIPANGARPVTRVG
jgi:drug/metabolite transporter (DMT)-like permease